jgi:hypothetical protein
LLHAGCIPSIDVLSHKLPDGVTELLTNRVDSFEKLEIIIALHAAPRTTMTVDDLCRALNLSREDVREATTDLRIASLVAVSSGGEVQLLPPTSRDRTAITDLVQSYQEDRLGVVKAMGEIAVNRIRGMTARAFADAFVIRKKPLKGGEDG